MVTKYFERISIKGRVAYGICCLERALIYYSCTLEKWTTTLEKFWNFTSVEYLDDWYYEAAEYLPDSLVEDRKYNADEFEYISEDQFYVLLELYTKEANSVISQLFRLVFEVGTIDLYSKIEGVAPNSLSYLEKIIKIMLQGKINMPPITDFSHYSYMQNNVWGESFQGKENSIIL